jgi:LacI family transcriptional regulator
MPVTLKDIAEKTGVSPSVVSTVLSGRDNGTFVSETTRRKVLQVAEMLNYTPVRSGRPRGSRRLRKQRTERFIGVWDSDYSPATANAIQCLQKALTERARKDGADGDDDFGLRLLADDDLPRLDVLGIMGVIILSPTPLPREAAVATIPCVMIGEMKNPPRELVQVHMDNFAAGRILGDYLWDLGHRRVAFMAPTAHERVTSQRFQGVQSAWLKRGADISLIRPAPYDTVKGADLHDQVRRVTQGFFGAEPTATSPTALICSDETVAAIALQTLAELGRRVPGDVSLAGFHDTPRLADSLIPPLTTIRIPIAEIAATAVDQLYLLHDSENLDRISQRDFSYQGELIVRSSCAALAAS